MTSTTMTSTTMAPTTKTTTMPPTTTASSVSTTAQSTMTSSSASMASSSVSMTSNMTSSSSVSPSVNPNPTFATNSSIYGKGYFFRFKVKFERLFYCIDNLTLYAYKLILAFYTCFDWFKRLRLFVNERNLKIDVVLKAPRAVVIR
jgi:hypothetical protein